MTVNWTQLARRLEGATGSDARLEAELAEAFGPAAALSTGSVDKARALVAAALPGWILHLGYGVTGVFPYAALSKDGTRIVCDAPTVPLAILRAAAGVMSSFKDAA